MREKRLKILEVMNSIDNKVEWEEFIERVGLNSSQTLRALRKLTKRGFLRKDKRSYSLTEKGKTALRTLNRIPRGMEFHFYTGIDQYTGLSAKNLQDFCELIKQVDPAVLNFHNSRGDFEKWIRTIFPDSQLANAFTQIRRSNLKGENLRKEILKMVKQTCQKIQKRISAPSTGN